MSPPTTSPAPASEAAALPAAPCMAPPSDPTQWFKEEVHPHGPMLKSYLRGQFPAVRDVEDVVQESFLRVWKARAAHPIESAKSFLFKVARHLALDVIRKDRNSPLEGGSDSAAARVLDIAPDAAQAYSTKDTIELLAKAIVALPTRYRSVVILHKLHCLPQKEVARQLGLSERTVENYCLRGMKKCEEFLREKGIHGFFG